MSTAFISLFKRTVIGFFVLAALLVTPAARAATSISQFGITWTFDKDYPAGQFANGDWWVVGPVTITDISPRSYVRLSDGATLNGSMINPLIGSIQGFDSRIQNNTFSALQNVGLVLPLIVLPGSSLMSAASYEVIGTGTHDSRLRTIAVLTVLSAPAPEGSFRPPYVGTDKTLRWNKSQLNYSKLRSLAPVAGTPSLSTVESKFERPWIEINTSWTGRYLHPQENQPDYGRDIAYELERGLLSLQLNYPNEQKEKLLIRMVQIGLDIYGAAVGGGEWSDLGGHNQGRKMPMLLAGVVLNDPGILNYADASKRFIFQEDRQTFYVSQADVDRPRYTADGRPRAPYTPEMIGIPEWGEQHIRQPNRDGSNWDAFYRTIVGSSIAGHVLTARLMGLESQWNWPPLFDYMDRYWVAERPNVGNKLNQIQSFTGNMWNAYRVGFQRPTRPGNARVVSN